MNSPAYDLAFYIRNVLGKGVALATDIMVDSMPDSPDNCITVFGDGGEESNHGMGNDQGALENYQLQVDVRNVDPSSAFSICNSIYRGLDELGSEVVINNTAYTWLHPIRPPIPILRDISPIRTTYEITIQCQRRRN
jgi:hypothetical protein